MIGRDTAAATVLATSFRAVAGFDALPPNKRKLFEDVLESALDPRVPGGLLPAPLKNGCRVYAVGTDQKEWRRLSPLLSAFAGPTLTSFTGVIQAPLGGDPLNAFARALPVEVVTVAEAQETSIEAMRALRRMIALLRHAPDGALQLPRPTSWLLSDFEDALNFGDRATAERLIDRLRDECRLDVLNLRFLKVQLLASLGCWSELRALSYFNDLCLARKPGPIAAHLAEALFQTELSSAFASTDAEKCRKAYENIRPLAAPIIRLPPPTSLGAGGFRLYACAALANDNPDPDLIKAVTTGTDLDWIASYFRTHTAEVLEPLVPEPEADYIQIRRALERLAELPSNQRNQLLESEPLRSLFTGGTVIEPKFVPLGWRDWLTQISDPNYTLAFDVARKGALEWPLDDASDPVAAGALADALADAITDVVSRARLAQALPLIVNWLQRDPDFPRNSMRPVYETVLALFALGEARDRGIMASTVIIGEALLSIGSSASDYQKLLQSLGTLFGEGIGTESVYLLLELIEATLRHPCPDSSAREEFWLTALAVLEPLRLRLEPSQIESLTTLGELLGWNTPPFAKSATTTPNHLLPKLANLRIGIYTLTETAARQAASVLIRLAPSAIVQTSSEHVGSAQLKVLAEKSDLLVITSLSATHAATDFIRAHRPTGKPICWAAGRGFTSIVRAVENFLEYNRS